MDDFNYLEEPPPIQRTVNPVETGRKPGLLAARSKVPSAPSAARDVGTAARPQSGNGVLLSLAALAVLIVQGWLYLGVRGDLADLRTRLEQSHSSLDQVSELAKGLDQDRMGRLGLLADSIRSVFDYAQGQVQLWSQRLDENDMARDGLERADQAQRTRLDALERQDRTHSYAFEALSRRAQTQETSTYNVSATVSYLRETLGKLDAALAAVEQRHAASTSEYGQLSRRVESVSVWADGFRRAGLSGESVQFRFSALGDEIRRLRMRVDSLRPMGRAITSSDNR